MGRADLDVGARPARLDSAARSSVAGSGPGAAAVSTGILHVHSRYSYDGRHSLDEIAADARRRGYGFVCMSEHSDTLDADSMRAHVDDCARVSTDECLIVPGVEFSLDQRRLHLLGFGVTRLTAAESAPDVARFIRDEGGVAVVAHPVRYGYAVADDLAAAVNGIEVWNGGYDGRFVPDDRVLALWRRLKARYPHLLAFGGPDLHRLTDHRHVTVRVDGAARTRDGIIGPLREGRFAVSNGSLSLAARTVPGPGARAALAVARRAFEGLRRGRRLVSRAH